MRERKREIMRERREMASLEASRMRALACTHVWQCTSLLDACPVPYARAVTEERRGPLSVSHACSGQMGCLIVPAGRPATSAEPLWNIMGPAGCMTTAWHPWRRNDLIMLLRSHVIRTCWIVKGANGCIHFFSLAQKFILVSQNRLPLWKTSISI